MQSLRQFGRAEMTLVCPLNGIKSFWHDEKRSVRLTSHLESKAAPPTKAMCFVSSRSSSGYFSIHSLQIGRLHLRSWNSRVSQVAKSLKNYTSRPESHYLGQTYLKIAKILKINAYLGVALLLQSYSTAVCSENS